MGYVLRGGRLFSYYPNRGYFRNRLKANLIAGKTYCVKLHVNISDYSSNGISNIGAFFVDNSIDTITKPHISLTYITPQVENSSANVLTDTMNWVIVTGTFIANGTEKNCVIGNFKSDANTTKAVINASISPAVTCDILIDDVSCIPLDLPAFAGPDIYAIPGNTVYIGRPQDVGIDEACMWYKLPNTTNAIDTAAGITLTAAATTETYMVKQDICGVIKYDTVVVYQSAVGLQSQNLLSQNLQVFPNPAQDFLDLRIEKEDLRISDCMISIYNSTGQLLHEEEIVFKNKTAKIKTDDLANGFYILSVKTKENYLINKRIIISR